MFVSDPDRIGMAEVLPPLPGCDHCPTLCDYLFEHCLTPSSHPPQLVRKWHKGRYSVISKLLSEVNWDFELEYRDAQGAYTRFLEILAPLKS